MPKIYRIISYLVFGLNGLLILFWIYSDKIEVPTSLQILGRTHPMLLHLPIGFFVMAVAILALQSQFKPKAFKASMQFIFALTALSVVVTALMGVLLSREGGYDNETLKGHLNSGVTLSVITAIIAGTVFQKKISNVQYGLISTGFLLLIVSGHYGATLTHGEGYLTGPSDEAIAQPSEDSITLFAKAVQPVFEKKCTSCHNPTKKKGELILTNQFGILKGGENGVVINLNDPHEGELIKRIHLEVNHDDHMPPSGKPQLSIGERALLSKWILGGADFESLWKSYPESDSLIISAKAVLATYEKPKDKVFEFDFASSDQIESLNSPFRTVSQISTEVPALKASFYLAQYFSPGDLKPLQTVKDQLVELNLAGMPITDKEIAAISEFENLEYLNLNNTAISDQSLSSLGSLKKLNKLALAGTKVTFEGLTALAKHEALSEVYLWNTAISAVHLKKLQQTNSKIGWDIGFQPNEKEILKLTPPILVSEVFLLKSDESIKLKHNLPGTSIRITLDGTEPDSVGATIYEKPILIQDHTTIKTLATKTGWLKSNALEYNFYLEGIKPLTVELLSPTDKSYKAKGAASLTDNQIGDPDNFRDGNWLGFRQNKMISQFTFPDVDVPKKMTLIYNKSIGSYLMPPESVEIWTGNDLASLKLLTKIKPEQPLKYMPSRSESISYEFKDPPKAVRVIGSPVPKLPKWHSGKGEKGWLMVSEVIFR